MFETLYLNNQIEFKYIGFPSETDRQAFAEKVQRVYSNLCNPLDKKYIVKNKVNIQNM